MDDDIVEDNDDRFIQVMIFLKFYSEKQEITLISIIFSFELIVGVSHQIHLMQIVSYLILTIYSTNIYDLSTFFQAINVIFPLRRD